RAARPRPQTPAPAPGPGKRDYTVLAPLRSRSGDNRFRSPTGIAVTARGTGGRISARPGTAQQAGHLVVFGPTGSGGRQEPGTTGWNHSVDARRMENPLGAPPRSRVLVTGGSGFIGRRLVAALLASGADVTVADRHQPSAPGARFVDGDLRDPAVAA